MHACVRAYAERACQQDSRATIYRGRPGLLLAVQCDMCSRVSPVPAPVCHTCPLPAWARAQPAAQAVQALACWCRALLLSSHLGRRSGSVRWQQQQPQPEQQQEGALPVGPPWVHGRASGTTEVSGRASPAPGAGSRAACWGTPWGGGEGGVLLPSLPALPGALGYRGLTLWLSPCETPGGCSLGSPPACKA